MKVRPVVEGWREVNECFVAPDLSYERSRSWANLTDGRDKKNPVK